MIFGKYFKLGQKKEYAPFGRDLTPKEKVIYGDGERLIPGVTHGPAEDVRHKSSYEFFCKVIESDRVEREKTGTKGRVEIVDLGCGVGHGCHRLSRVPDSHITGIDVSPESIEYAREHYNGENITYRRADLLKFIPEMPPYDYVVSRGVFEHMRKGLRLALSTKWALRLLFDVPYDEAKGPNRHHLLTGIREEDFSGFPAAELFYQDLDGIVYDAKIKPPGPNMIICVCSNPSLPRVGGMDLRFPLPAWKDNG